jgi:ornithine carbamoyltransferase
MPEVTDALRGRNFTRINDWSHDELLVCLDLADELKAMQRRREEHRLLPGRTLAMIFNRPSLRTRVSFEVAMAHLGGTAIDLRRDDALLGEREPLRDSALVLSRYVDGIVIRSPSQDDVDAFAREASVPVINGLTDVTHPCQALTDLMTIRERLGRLSGVRLAYLGDGNNVCRSLMRAAAKFGLRFIAACPPGREPAPEAVRNTRQVAIQQGGAVELINDPREAATGAQVIYTDVWTSMGQESERELRRTELAALGFTVDAEMLSLADPNAVVMHCLPAHAGEEITEDVLYGPRSVAWEQAENRLHAQKALLALVLR